jgi:predicted dehydrogenase
MKFGLLGYNDGLRELLDHIHGNPDHQIVLAFVDQQAAALPETTQIQPASSWEAILDHPDIDAVILAAPDSPNAVTDDQLRKLAQTGIRIIVQHPACESIVGYEIEMIRVEYGSELLPYMATCHHPHLATLAGWITAEGDSPIGSFQSLSMERHPSSYRAEELMKQFSHDLVLLECLVGNPRRLSAIGSDHDDPEWRQLNINVVSDTGLMASWVLHRGDGKKGSRIVAVGSRGHAILSFGGPEEGVSLCLYTDNEETKELEAPSRLSVAFTDSLARPGSLGDSWYRAMRTIEFGETIPWCLRRGRAIDITAEPPSEQRSFKGAMSIASCGILLSILAFLFALAVFEGFRYPANYNKFMDQQDDTAVNQVSTTREAPFLVRIWPVYPILLFLLLQLLLLIARKKSTPTPISSPAGTD